MNIKSMYVIGYNVPISKVLSHAKSLKGFFSIFFVTSQSHYSTTIIDSFLINVLFIIQSEQDLKYIFRCIQYLKVWGIYGVLVYVLIKKSGSRSLYGYCERTTEQPCDE